MPSGILIHPAVWPQWTWAEKWGAAVHVPVLEGELGLHLTMWPGPRPTSMPSFIKQFDHIIYNFISPSQHGSIAVKNKEN